MRMFKVNGCDLVSCSLRVRRAGQYFLMTFGHSIPSFPARLSRFLMQTTFGPTRDMIDNWSYPRNLKGMARWVKRQMRFVPATKHREYLRSHADHFTYNNTINDRNIAIQHPCAENSRWQKYSFSFYDNNRDFEVVRAGSNKYAVKINGIVRTVMNSFVSDGGDYSGYGEYTFCEFFYLLVV